MILITMIMNFFLLMLIVKRLKIEKYIKKIIQIYLIFTFCICIISTFNPFKINEVDDYTYIMWLININIFTLTYCFTMVKYNNKKSNKVINTSSLEHSKILRNIQIMLMFILGYYALRFHFYSSKLVDASEIRMIKFTYLFNSYAENVFYNFLVTTLYQITTMILAIFIVNKKVKNSVCIIGIINVILYMLIGYGRMSIYYFVQYILIAFFLNKDYNKVNKKRKLNIKKIILVITSVLVIFLVSLIPTAVRTGINIFDFNGIYNRIINTQFESIILYFTGGFRTLDIFLKNGFPNLSYTCGRATLGGIDEIIGTLLNIIGLNISSLNSMLGTYTQIPIDIGVGKTFNAFYTCLMNFYLDFGYLGIIIGPFIHSLLLIAVTINYKKQKNLFSEVLLIYVINNAFSSIYRWNYQSGASAFTLITLIIINAIYAKNSKKVIDINNNDKSLN